MEKLFEILINEETGVINCLCKEEAIVGEIPLHAYTAIGYSVINKLENTGNSTIFNGSGFNFFNKRKAKIAAVFEKLERYAPFFEPENQIRTSFYDENSSKIFLDISEVTQKKTNNLDKNTIYEWVLAKSNLQGDKWIPKQLCYFLKNESEPLIREMVSTGLAAHTQVEEAYKRGILECIERDSITIYWHRKISPSKLNKSTIHNSKFKKLVKTIADINLQMEILDMSLDHNVPVYFCCIVSKKPPYFSCGAACDFNPEKAINKAVVEAMATYNINVRNLFDPNKLELTINDVKNAQNMDDHSSLFSSNDLVEQYEFLLQGKEITFIESIEGKLNNISFLESEFLKKGIEILTTDITPKDIKEIGVVVLRVIIPSFAFLECTVPMCKTNRWGMSSVNENDFFPHPFP
ncbi:YcaO-like family protein [Carnobacterium maltaromaticum]|uniref:YcaO-like family protein n=1 Tax=Carnobacterium maltaromaticum TaxID=2751 RepID=UPI0039BE8BB5